MGKKIHVSNGAIVTDVASTQRYMQEIKKFGYLDREQEKELGRAAQAGNRALTLASLNNFFQGCVIGSDAIVRATGTNSSITLLAGSGSSYFKGCIFPMWSSVAASTFIVAAATTAAGYMIFDECIFVNDINNAGGTALTQAFSISATTGASLIMTPSTVVAGATILNTGSTGTIYTSTPLSAATGNKVITAT